jgi:hypothetical protein
MFKRNRNCCWAFILADTILAFSTPFLVSSTRNTNVAHNTQNRRKMVYGLVEQLQPSIGSCLKQFTELAMAWKCGRECHFPLSWKGQMTPVLN